MVIFHSYVKLPEGNVTLLQVSSRLFTGVTISSGPKSSSVIAGDVKLGREMMVGGKKPRSQKSTGRWTKRTDLSPTEIALRRER